jgi:hypothetical protein
MTFRVAWLALSNGIAAHLEDASIALWVELVVLSTALMHNQKGYQLHFELH